MIKVPFTEPIDDTKWTKWRKKADDRKKDVIELFLTGKEYKISQAFYSRMRQVFLDAFHGKCAYCEALIKVDQHQGCNGPFGIVDG